MPFITNILLPLVLKTFTLSFASAFFISNVASVFIPQTMECVVKWKALQKNQNKK